MRFQIHALPAQDFSALFALPDDELAQRNACRVVVTECPGTPCRISLADAEIGETVLLLNYQHQSAQSPYQASHAIFVRQGVAEAKPAVNEVPLAIQSRLISLRLFDQNHMMVNADVVQGTALAQALMAAFADPAVSYAHLHYAKPGCYAARVTRVA
ncbi:DUF1203 domain-containing protein [Pseudorhodobacter wandonensis]|uniref:DUF1203 domain-containing protein n=1 Tax=Pseudorhodobacter wandonensis TaxID=1120568 RepID=UPI00067E2F89|nr:DUF1203 domain-containing protein [Pseudorhodobacter wandonensis]